MRFNLAPAVLLALATANTTLAAPRPSRNETRADVGVRPDMIMARNPTHMHMSHVDTVMGRDRDNEKGKEMGKSGSVYEDMGMKADLDRFATRSHEREREYVPARMAMDQSNARPIQGSMIMAMDREQRHDQDKDQDKDDMQMIQSVTTSRRHSSMSGRKEDNNSAMEAGMMKQMQKHQGITVREDAMQKEQPEMEMTEDPVARAIRYARTQLGCNTDACANVISSATCFTGAREGFNMKVSLACAGLPEPEICGCSRCLPQLDMLLAKNNMCMGSSA
ncbi:hypothetical protein MPDQ_005303 [Monascus purpureus]|uniref:Uncharacterized protein n=1 Tax=Monascus purpureus TaxID=5098 RepID=A0A507QWY9_MONPU|nr:hypothetical protein MPDQ_005303 [Monascus purpureus]BDD58053.1 hypothetical protein MAP00_003363 [Monascus purpureus]